MYLLEFTLTDPSLICLSQNIPFFLVFSTVPPTSYLGFHTLVCPLKIASSASKDFYAHRKLPLLSKRLMSCAPLGVGKISPQSNLKGKFWFWNNVFVLFLCLLDCHLLCHSYWSFVHWETNGTRETVCSCFSQLCGRRSVKPMKKQNRLDADVIWAQNCYCQISSSGEFLKKLAL